MARPTRLVLMDLGGVLLQLRDPFEAFGLQYEHSEFLQRWLLSPAVRGLERGQLDAAEFARVAVQEFELDYSADEFMQRFERWPMGLFDDIPGILRSIPTDCSLALLSNTNAIHWNRDDIAGMLEPLLDHAFLSFETGLLKPDDDAFEDVLRHYQVSAGEVLFVDDNALNIEAAARLGFDARLTRGARSFRSHLADARII